MANKHGEYIWYELITADPDGAKAFYDSVIGWNIGDKPEGDMDYRMINAGDRQVGGVMRLTDEMAAGGAKPTWLGYIGVDDVDVSVAATVAAGGQVHLPAFDIPNVGRIAMVTDPQGAPFYLMRPASDEGNSTAFVGDEGVSGHCNWNELVTSDSEAALEFYTKAFNWTRPEPTDMGEMGKYHFIASGDTTIGAICGPMPDMGPPAWNCYFNVPSIDAAIEKVKAGGGSISMGPQQVPGDYWYIIGNDPQGATFCLVGPK